MIYINCTQKHKGKFGCLIFSPCTQSRLELSPLLWQCLGWRCCSGQPSRQRVENHLTLTLSKRRRKSYQDRLVVGMTGGTGFWTKLWPSRRQPGTPAILRCIADRAGAESAITTNQLTVVLGEKITTRANPPFPHTIHAEILITILTSHSDV